MICPECKGKGEVKYYRETERDGYSVAVEGFLDICHTCHGSGVKTVTNADHIRSMTDEELMGFLFNEVSCGSICEFCVPVPRKSTKCDGHCRNGILDWLKQPYGGD